MEVFSSLIGSAIVLGFIIFVVTANLFRLVMWIKCFKVKRCQNRRCINNIMCGKYTERMTEEEYQKLLDKIEAYKKAFEERQSE